MARSLEINENEMEPPTVHVLEINEYKMELRPFTIDGEINIQYRRFNAEGAQLTVRLFPPYDGEDSNAMSHFLASVTHLSEYALQNCKYSDMVGITMRNKFNLHDKAIEISFRRKDQITSNEIWSVFERVAQSNARFKALDKLGMTIHSVKCQSAMAKSLLRVDRLGTVSI